MGCIIIIIAALIMVIPFLVLFSGGWTTWLLIGLLIGWLLSKKFEISRKD